MEWAFKGPHTLRERLGDLDARAIAAMPEADLVAAFTRKPALHRFPGSMGKRTHALCTHIVETYDGDPAAIWTTAASANELFDRLRALPGFGDEKSRIFLAVLGKRLGVAPSGWETVAEPFGDETPRSVADIDSAESLGRVREWKRAQKAKAKTKAE